MTNGFEMHGLGHLSASSLNVASSDPFKIEGPALISFSGGRTSGYMLWRILQAHGGTLPSDVHVTFANTGKEMQQTLDFVKRCAERWRVDVVWLEYYSHDEPSQRWRRVSQPSTIGPIISPSRNGEPFAALIRRKQYLPNPVARICTVNLKLKPMEGYAVSLGWDDYLNVVGLRADEPSRVARMRGSHAVPLAVAGVTKPDVMAFWAQQDFDLALAPGQGNCDLCFLTSAATIQGIMRDVPGVADWWVEQEANRAATFRSDSPSYAEMAKAVREQRTFDFGTRDEIIDCFCGDAA